MRYLTKNLFQRLVSLLIVLLLSVKHLSCLGLTSRPSLFFMEVLDLIGIKDVSSFKTHDFVNFTSDSNSEKKAK